MANIAINILQKLEGLASSGKKYGTAEADENSQHFEALTGAAWQEQRNEGSAITLPQLEVAFTVIKGESSVGEILLPSLTSDGWTGGQSELDLPSLTLSATGEVPGQGLADLTLPSLVAEGTGTVAGASTAALTLPRLSLSSWFAGSASLTLPFVSISASGSAEEQSQAALTLPRLTMTGSISVASYPSSASLVLPALVAGQTSAAYLTLPLLQVVGYDAGSIAGNGVGVGAFEGWALNARTGSVSHIVNWPFRQIVKWGDKLIGVGNDGLYEIGSTLDVGQPIQWEWRTGLDSMGLAAIKRFPWVYFDAVIDGEIVVTVEDDKGEVYKYRYEAEKGPVNIPHRRRLGQGIRSRHIAFGAKNGSVGAYMKLNALGAEAIVTERSI